MTDVVAALIWDGDRFLACQRPAHKTRGLLWEFVGGKVEPGETKQQALIRECLEELAVTVDVQEVFMEVIHEYPDMTVRLSLFNTVITGGVPQMLEHNDFRWLRTIEIDDYPFCPADVEILEKLKSIRSGLDARLFASRDDAYRQFQSPLMPTVSLDRIVGVRTPVLRKIGKDFAKRGNISAFLTELPHRYFEEDNVHALLINDMRNYEDAVSALNAFLPHVDNWATCDMLSPKAFKKCPEALPAQICEWLASRYPYAVRFGIGALMKFYLEDTFRQEYLSWVANIRSDEYYINMMIAWYFATALAKQYESTLPYLQDWKLDRWTHNKTIRKAIESYRITDAQKQYLRTLKR